MHAEIKEISPCVKKLEIEISPETVKEELDKAYRQLGRTVTLGGFRPGKIPRSILEGRYKNTVEKEVIQKLIPESCHEALQDKGIEAAGDPVVGEEIKIVKDQPLKFSVTVEVIPPIVLKPYEGMEFTKRLANITEDDMARALKNIQESSAEYEVTPDAVAEMGDLMVVDWRAESPGNPLSVSNRENFAMVLGSSIFGAEVEKPLVGSQVNEQRTASVVYPPDYKERDWAGKAIQFEFTVKELKKKKLPEIDGEFAKGLGYQDLDDLKLNLRKQLEAFEEITSSNNLGKEVVSRLIQENPIEEPPPTMVENRIQRMIIELQQRLNIQGPVESPLNMEKLRADFKKVAEERVKGELILKKIAEAENLAVSEEDINKELEALASRRGMSVKSLKDIMTKNDSLDALRFDILLEKALNTVLAKSHIETLRGSREELFPQDSPNNSSRQKSEEPEEEGRV